LDRDERAPRTSGQIGEGLGGRVCRVAHGGDDGLGIPVSSMPSEGKVGTYIGIRGSRGWVGPGTG
jgi:hypothetical protein